MSEYLSLPPNVRHIWSTTPDDLLLFELHKSSKKIEEKLHRHQEILKELLVFFTRHEVNFRKPRDVKEDFNKESISQTAEVSRESLGEK